MTVQIQQRNCAFEWWKVLKFICYLLVFCTCCVVMILYFRHEWDAECYPRIGCFDLSGPWYERPSPFNFFPKSPAAINTTFIISSGKEGQREERTILFPINLSEVNNFKWGQEDLIVFIVHGYTDDSTTWMQDLQNTFLSLGDITVVLVDWRNGAAGFYPQVVANTRVVAREIVRLIGHIIRRHNNQNYSSFHIKKRFHIVGHSLGAQIASYVGKDIKAPLGPIYQITALDPAFPLFEGHSSEIRLHQKDAQHVLVIHSNIGPWGLGMKEAVGTVDIYLNDGRDQRGCVLTSSLISRPLDLQSKNVTFEGLSHLKDLIACSHRRAYEFLDAILRSLHKPHSEDYGDFVAYPMIMPEATGVELADKKLSFCQRGQDECWKLTWNLDDFFFHLPTPDPSGFFSQSTSFYMPTTNMSPFCSRVALLEIFTCPTKLPSRLDSLLNNYQVSISYIKFGNEMTIFSGKVFGSQKIQAWIDLSCESIENAFSNTNGKLNVHLSISYEADNNQQLAKSDTKTVSNSTRNASRRAFCWSKVETQLTYYDHRRKELKRLKPCLMSPISIATKRNTTQQIQDSKSFLSSVQSGTDHCFKIIFTTGVKG